MSDQEGQLRVEPGDLCHHGSNLLPTYRVIWIDGSKAWLRDVNSGQDAVVELSHCHKLRDSLARQLELEAEPPHVGPSGLTWPDGTPRP